MLACSVSALFATSLPAPGQWLILCLWAVAYVALIYLVNATKLKPAPAQGSKEDKSNNRE